MSEPEKKETHSQIEVAFYLIIESCNLSWGNKLLESYNASHTITAGSQWQARQPIYTSSQRRWVNYSHHLGEFANKLSDYLSPEDIIEFKKKNIEIIKKLGFSFFK